MADCNFLYNFFSWKWISPVKSCHTDLSQVKFFTVAALVKNLIDIVTFIIVCKCVVSRDTFTHQPSKFVTLGHYSMILNIFLTIKRLKLLLAVNCSMRNVTATHTRVGILPTFSQGSSIRAALSGRLIGCLTRQDIKSIVGWNLIYFI